MKTFFSVLIIAVLSACANNSENSEVANDTMPVITPDTVDTSRVITPPPTGDSNVVKPDSTVESR
ncbi:MAG: hypothetical protein JNK79_11375 [Chitinophagaceae bacterium]|nr:hypothetical protein [Chitinophagaceae bacterium]